MQERYALRFESGERRGEIIAVLPGGLTLGRRPGNSVQVLDASVSGRHAELTIDERGVTLRDLGSTNGTRVGPERVSEKRLAHGDQVTLGSVRFTFIDQQLDGIAPSAGEPDAGAGAGEDGELFIEGLSTAVAQGPASGAGSGERPTEAVRTISADKLARTKTRGVLAGGLLLVALGAAAAWYFLPRGGVQAQRARRAVEPVAGNLIGAGFSFEEEGKWEGAEDAPVRFLADPSGAASGALGLRAALSNGEWALERSPEASVQPRRLVKAQAQVSADGDVSARVGVELASSNRTAGRAVAWSPAVEVRSGFQTLELTVPVPAGYDRARVCLLSRAKSDGGLALIDDASLVFAAGAGGAGEGLALIGEYRAVLLGEPARSLVLTKIDRPLLSDLRVATGDDALGDKSEPLSVEASGNGFAVRFTTDEEQGTRALSLRIEPEPTAQGIATLGEGGYRTHQVEFTREHTASLLAGAGNDLVRIAFDPPVTLTGRPDENGFRVRAELGDAREIRVQLAFGEERAASEDLARAARAAEKEQKLGTALAQWKALLDRSPFEGALIQEAETARSRMIQTGLTEVDQARAKVESAQFFRLADLYRACRERAAAIADRYQGSEVEAPARELLQRIDAEVDALEQDKHRAERERLESILTVLEQQKMEGLAARVREALQRTRPVGGPQ